MAVLAQIRTHLRQKEQEVREAASAEAVLGKRLELLKHLIDDAKDPKSGKKGEDATGDDTSDKPAAAPLNPAVALGINAIFTFLAEVAETHPELCVKPLQLLADVVGAYAPQQLSDSCM